jgi:hypothetical protein
MFVFACPIIAGSQWEIYDCNETLLVNCNCENILSNLLLACFSFLRASALNANFSFAVQQIRHKFKIQKVDNMEEKRQRNCVMYV